MSEIRRSSRANKGVNNRLINELKMEEELAASVNNNQNHSLSSSSNATINVKNKKKKTQSKPIIPKETVRCLVCGTIDSNYDEDADDKGTMIQCEKCLTWQHAKCVFNTENKRKLPKEYVCFTCDPEADERYKGIEDRCTLKYQDYIKQLNESNAAEDKDFQDEGEDEDEQEDSGSSDEEDEDNKVKRQQRNDKEFVVDSHRRSSLKKDKANDKGKPSSSKMLNKTRESVIKQFELKFLSIINDDESSQDLYTDKAAKCNDLAVKLEEGIFNKYKKTVNQDYLNKVRSLIFNLTSSKNKFNILRQIFSKDIEVTKLVDFSKEDFMDEDERKKLKDMIQKSIEQVVLVNDESDNINRRIKRTHKGEEVIELNDELLHSEKARREKERSERKLQEYEYEKSKRVKFDEGVEDENNVDSVQNEKESSNSVVNIDKEVVKPVLDSKSIDREDSKPEKFDINMNLNLNNNYMSYDDEEHHDHNESYDNNRGDDERDVLKDDFLDEIIGGERITKESIEEKQKENQKERQYEEEENEEEYNPELLDSGIQNSGEAKSYSSHNENNENEQEIGKCEIKLIGISEFPAKIIYSQEYNNSKVKADSCKRYLKSLMRAIEDQDNLGDLNIDGRLDINKCFTYLNQIKDIRDLMVLKVEVDLDSNREEEGEGNSELNKELLNNLYLKLVNYFKKREKIGVINNKSGNEMIKDVYLVYNNDRIKQILPNSGGDNIKNYDNDTNGLYLVLVIKRVNNEINNLLNVLR